MLGHVGEKCLRETSKLFGWKLVGNSKVCTGCAAAKAKAHAGPKMTQEKATTPGERLFIDISGPYAKSAVGNQYWVMAVDDYTRKCWSYFIKKKSDIGTVIGVLLTKLAGAGHKTKFVQCDDAGENSKQLKKVYENQGVEMEFTAPHTPQHNGVVECGFVTVRQRALTMMLNAKFTDEYQGLLWAEAVHTATRLTNSTVNSVTKKSPDDEFYRETNTRRPYKLCRQFGSVGWVTIREGVKKLDACSIKCVFLGYSDDLSQDTYRMYNHETNTVVNTRDVKWSEWHGTNVPTDGLEKKMFKPVTNQQDTEISVQEVNEELHDDFYTHVCKLVKAMYGIVQAPRYWSRTFAKCVTNKPGMTKSKIDPMLFMHRNKDGQIDGLLVNHVDDGIVCGTPSAVEYMKNVIKEDFNITEQGILQKHLGVEYAWKEDKYGEYWEGSADAEISYATSTRIREVDRYEN